MIRTAEAEGKDIFAAAAAARAKLGIGEDEGSVEVLVRPRSGFLGIGSRLACVRVSVESEDAPAAGKKPVPEKKKAPEKKPEGEKKAPVQEKKPASVKKPAPPRPEETPAAAKSAPADPAERKAQVEGFLRGLLEQMDVEAEIIITDREGGGLNVELAGPNMGAVIGRRGETLDAIQHLTNYALNRGGEKHMHISVDAEAYRSKREDSLVHLAEKMAAKALKYNRSMALEPMNSYERHVIHTALQNYEGVTTASTGTEPNRRVVVSVVRPAGEKTERSGRNSGRSRSKAPREKKESIVTAPAEEQTAAPAPVQAAEPVPAPVEKPAPAEKPIPAEKPAPVMPEGYEPINKNKPTSREWC